MSDCAGTMGAEERSALLIAAMVERVKPRLRVSAPKIRAERPVAAESAFTDAPAVAISYRITGKIAAGTVSEVPRPRLFVLTAQFCTRVSPARGFFPMS